MAISLRWLSELMLGAASTSPLGPSRTRRAGKVTITSVPPFRYSVPAGFVFLVGLPSKGSMASLVRRRRPQRCVLTVAAARLDARQIENVVDECEEIVARMVNVVGIVAVGCDVHRAEHFA